MEQEWRTGWGQACDLCDSHCLMMLGEIAKIAGLTRFGSLCDSQSLRLRHCLMMLGEIAKIAGLAPVRFLVEVSLPRERVTKSKRLFMPKSDTGIEVEEIHVISLEE